MSDIPAKASNVLQTNACLKVSSKSSPASVAGAIAGMMKDGVPVEIQLKLLPFLVAFFRLLA